MTFGYGLGDIFHFGLLALFEFIMIVFGITFNVKGKSFKWLNWIWSIVLIWTLLQLTIFRGPAWSWNGEIFFKP